MMKDHFVGLKNFKQNFNFKKYLKNYNLFFLGIFGFKNPQINYKKKKKTNITLFIHKIRFSKTINLPSST